ncbi:MAG: SH3 beta-barrel fold-containing protein [Candidatus Hodarchaeota archaeon]
MNQITLKEAVKLIKETDGQIFKVTFRKKDGTFRKMVCRLGVKKDLKGVGLKFDPDKYKLLTVWDMENDGYRMVNLKTLLYVTVNGQKYEVKNG